jgi:hypothetical protein
MTAVAGNRSRRSRMRGTRSFSRQVNWIAGVVALACCCSCSSSNSSSSSNALPQICSEFCLDESTYPIPSNCGAITETADNVVSCPAANSTCPLGHPQSLDMHVACSTGRSMDGSISGIQYDFFPMPVAYSFVATLDGESTQHSGHVGLFWNEASNATLLRRLVGTVDQSNCPWLGDQGSGGISWPPSSGYFCPGR